MVEIDKGALHNEISHLHGKFKQAKVNTISKMVQKLKNPDKLPKQNREKKIDRLTNAIHFLGKTHPCRLAVQALLQYKSGVNYLAKQDATVDEYSVGYFCEFKTIPPILDLIRDKYHLSESVEWRTTMKDWFKKDKTAEKEKKSKKLKKATKKNSPGQSDKKVKKGAKVKTELSEIKEEQKTPKLKSEKKQKLEKVKKESTEQLDDASGDQTATPTTVDDFFITADGSNYISTAVINRTQEDGPDDGLDRRARRAQQQGRSANDKQTPFGKKTKSFEAKTDPNRFIGGKRKWTEESIDESEAKAPRQIDPELHPSWQAKQKQKPVISEFKGSKIVFGED